MQRKEKEKVFKPRKLARSVAKANMKKEGIKQAKRKFINNNWRRYVILNA